MSQNEKLIDVVSNKLKNLIFFFKDLFFTIFIIFKSFLFEFILNNNYESEFNHILN